jgi:putative intracellular protease/amidase
LSPNNNLRLFIPRCRAYRRLAIHERIASVPHDRKETEMATVQGAAQHHEIVDVTTSKRPKVLIVVANPTSSTTTGWPIGFWAAELTHPYYAFSQVRYDVTIASPEGGKVELDALSDPRDESKWSADDLISMGFLNTPELTALLENTPRLADLDPGEFDALVVCGGNAPMFQFRENEDLKRTIAAFYEAEKPTALLCHGVSALTLPDRGRAAETWGELHPGRSLQGLRRSGRALDHRPAAVLGAEGRGAGNRRAGDLVRTDERSPVNTTTVTTQNELETRVERVFDAARAR